MSVWMSVSHAFFYLEYKLHAKYFLNNDDSNKTSKQMQKYPHTYARETHKKHMHTHPRNTNKKIRTKNAREHRIEIQVHAYTCAVAKISSSEKVVPATMEFVDIAGIVKGASEGLGLGNKFLANIRECDAIVRMLRYMYVCVCTYMRVCAHKLNQARVLI
jgi:hypothetical protein